VQRVVPALRVTDPERARAFYVDALGFRVDWEWRDAPDAPAFSMLSRAGLSLYLTQHAGDASAGARVYLYVADVDAWHGELVARGVAVEAPPRTQPWGNREMLLRDPDGNRICIATPVPVSDASDGAPGIR
jgi:catechol 2,3-dioxygenase-like lactoylglutathione lyase family enzyme